MKRISNIDEMRAISSDIMRQGCSIGFVPTMGFFHDGHVALMHDAARRADCVIVSLFVNPAQFGPDEDLDKYPRDIKRDISIAEDAGVDFLFTPLQQEFYPAYFQTWIDVEELSCGLCGASRPGHFRGVATVVAKLFNIIMPDVAIFGMKDFQQLQIVRQMVKDLNMPVKIIAHPIVREADGLAMSSRNRYLSPEERRQAIGLNESLDIAEKMARDGERSPATIAQAVAEYILSFPCMKIDYIFIGDPETLQPLSSSINNEFLTAVAAYVGTTRLIDNRIVTIK